MEIGNSSHHGEGSLSKNQAALEAGLPPYLEQSLTAMKKSWEILDRSETDYHWDICWCDLNTDINNAELCKEISTEQAKYLRLNYLRIEIY